MPFFLSCGIIKSLARRAGRASCGAGAGAAVRAATRAGCYAAYFRIPTE